MASPYSCVNKGAQIAVWDDSRPGKKQIGTIYANEAYVVYGGEGSYHSILFRNSSGSLAYGFLENASFDQLSRMADYPFETIVVDGLWRTVFKMRRSENIYKKDATSWGSVASGRRVCVEPDICGQSNPNWCKITFVENSSGVWTAVTSGSGASNAYGFVDMGLDHGSFNSTISMYGTW